MRTAPDLDVTAIEAARRREAELTKPAGSLGRLEELAIWLCGVQGRCPPDPLERITLVIFAGDHGVAEVGASAYPPAVTAQMVANFLAGGAAANVLASQAGVRLRVADVSVAGDHPWPEAVRRWHVADGSGRIDVTDGIPVETAATAMAAGRAIADEEIDAGTQMLIAGDMGIGNTTPAAALIGVLTGRTAGEVTGRGTGVDDRAFARKRAMVAAAICRGTPWRDDPVRLVAAIGGADLAAMAGFLAEAAGRRTPVVLDGVVTGAAALLAERLTPGARRWWVAGHRSAEPGHAIALAELELPPILDLGLRLGEGTGALLAVPILRAAAATLTHMATFASAGVSGRYPPPGASRDDWAPATSPDHPPRAGATRPKAVAEP